ncbi:uncharacterized protein G2W53_033744 [Senna tora]|uniref:Uncharacterized protein n=1 Tax=Senna tora TaxID=362788 RepID=A0A834SY28_9FABA|nr:uncharacterized protein G2W53_033744 [Senna tora]
MLLRTTPNFDAGKTFERSSKTTSAASDSTTTKGQLRSWANSNPARIAEASRN